MKILIDFALRFLRSNLGTEVVAHLLDIEPEHVSERMLLLIEAVIDALLEGRS